MKILILEDNAEKLQDLRAYLADSQSQAEVHSVGTYTEYLKAINREKYDLLIIDLVVPRHSSDSSPVEIEEIVDATRCDYECQNIRTPGIALTGYDQKAEDSFKNLNQNDLTVVTYTYGSQAWKTALGRKIATLPSLQHYDFVIICALEKEENGFSEAGFPLGRTKVVSGLHTRSIQIAGRPGVVVTAPRMGLVTASITATQAILAFQPQVICMSGICGGVPKQASIYDVVIAETCHQHDAGKWTNGRLLPEIYSVAIDHQFAQQAKGIIGDDGFRERVSKGVVLSRKEFPPGADNFSYSVKLATASSGSAVLGDEQIVASIKEQQRKCAIFDMESYAVYEAARLSTLRPRYFSAKTVVDDGSEGKADDFHRVGCILSARVTAELLALCEFQ